MVIIWTDRECFPSNQVAQKNQYQVIQNKFTCFEETWLLEICVYIHQMFTTISPLPGVWAEANQYSMIQFYIGSQTLVFPLQEVLGAPNSDCAVISTRC